MTCEQKGQRAASDIPLGPSGATHTFASAFLSPEWGGDGEHERTPSLHREVALGVEATLGRSPGRRLELSEGQRAPARDLGGAELPSPSGGLQRGGRRPQALGGGGRERSASSVLGPRLFPVPAPHPGIYLWQVGRQGVCEAFLHKPHAEPGGLNGIKRAHGFARHPAPGRQALRGERAEPRPVRLSG